MPYQFLIAIILPVFYDVPSAIQDMFIPLPCILVSTLLFSLRAVFIHFLSVLLLLIYFCSHVVMSTAGLTGMSEGCWQAFSAINPSCGDDNKGDIAI